MITPVNISPARRKAWYRAEIAKDRYLKVLLNGDGSQSLAYTVEDWDKTDISVHRVDDIPDGHIIVQSFHEKQIAKMWYEAWKRKAGISIDP